MDYKRALQRYFYDCFHPPAPITDNVEVALADIIVEHTSNAANRNTVNHDAEQPNTVNSVTGGSTAGMIMVANDSEADQTNTVNPVTGGSTTGMIVVANDYKAEQTLGNAETMTGMILVNDNNVMQ